MKVAIMQPYIFPYIGYFQLINAVDKFVFYDDVNFIKKGWIHRNNILINGTSNLFTIPCKKISQNKLINEIELDFDIVKKNKLLKKIELAYKKATYFDNVFPSLKTFFHSDKSNTIAELAANSVLFVCNYLDMKTSFVYSSKKHAASKGIEKEQRLIQIAKKEAANIYINAVGGKDLYKKDSFKDMGIELSFLDSLPVSYKQFDNKFNSSLSILDVLMFNSKEEVLIHLNKFRLID